MNYRSLFSLLGFLLILIAAILLFFGLIGFFIYPEEEQGIYFLFSSLSALFTGFIFRFNTKPSVNAELNYREGFAVASFGWILVAFFGALPFYFSGVIPLFINAYFESISGFTTTGASILSDIESLGHTMLLWRAFTQWLGGMGIIVLTLAIIPTLGAGGMQLFAAEVPGPIPDKIVPRVGKTAKNLYLLYSLFTITQIFLLYWGGMNFFESLCHSFSTLSTGGFSPLNSSIGSYQEGKHFHENYLYFEAIISIFMFLSGISFVLHYRFLTGHFSIYFKSHEFLYYISVAGCLILFIAFNLYTHNLYTNLSEIIRHTTFTVISIYTSTGFGTVDFDLWPSMSKVLILGMMFCGGMSGSTTGGAKTIRISAMLKTGFLEIKRTIYPKRIFAIHFGSEYLNKEVAKAINAFMMLFIIIYITGVIILSYTGLDIESLISMVASCLGNTGPGFGKLGPTKNYSNLPDSAKWILSLFMLMGRLEILPIIVLFLPRVWHK